MKRFTILYLASLLFGPNQAVFGQAASTGSAHAYPTKPIRLIVPFPAGESIDAVARMISQPWHTALGQQIVIDNRGGAGGTIGTELVAKATPDGYTISYGNLGPLSIDARNHGRPAATRLQYHTRVPAARQGGPIEGAGDYGQQTFAVAPAGACVHGSRHAGIESSAWHAVVAPAGTPKEIIRKLHQTLAATLAAPALRDQLTAQGAEPVASSPEEFARFMRAESDKWARVIKSAGVTAGY